MSGPGGAWPKDAAGNGLPGLRISVLPGWGASQPINHLTGQE
jgi:hypothetical protein